MGSGRSRSVGLALLTVCLLLGARAPGAGAAPASGDGVTVQYKLAYTFSNTQGANNGSASLTLDFDETMYEGTWGELQLHNTTKARLLSLAISGSSTARETNPDGSVATCQESFGPPSHSLPVFSVAPDSDHADELDITGNFPFNVDFGSANPIDVLVIQDQNNYADCGDGGYPTPPSSDSAWENAAVWGGGSTPPLVYRIDGSGVYGVPLNQPTRLTDTYNLASGDITEHAQLNSSVTVTVGGSTPSGPPKLTGPTVAKRLALKDMRGRTIPNAMRYCIPFTAHFLVAGAGLLIAPAAAIGGGALVVSGSLTSAAMLPFCNASLTALVSEYRTYRDPPDFDVFAIARPAASAPARLPGCRAYHGSAGQLCTSLRSAYATLISAARRLGSVQAAIETTVSRAHAAILTHQTAALHTQEAHLTALEAQRTSALAAERRAGNGVAAVLARDGIGFRLNRAQSAKVIAAAEQALSRRGLSAHAIGSVDALALRARATNLLADLRHL